MTTSVIDPMIHQHIELLDRRAKAYGRIANFNLITRDACAVTGYFFNKLEILYLKDYDTSHVTRLFCALRSLSTSLKKFTMKNILGEHASKHVIPLKAVISTCPNLEAFHYEQFAIVTEKYEDGFLWPGVSSSLIHVTLCSPKELKAADSQQIAQACPKLSKLLHIRYYEPSCLKNINRICKNLKTLYLNCVKPFHDSMEEDSNDEADRSDDEGRMECAVARTGLQELGITLTESSSHFETYFETHCTTIKNLGIEIPEPILPPNADIDWTNMSLSFLVTKQQGSPRALEELILEEIEFIIEVHLVSIAQILTFRKLVIKYSQEYMRDITRSDAYVNI
ncbi:hypothetical protein BDA99DRAFT_537281 [Phascolomyces articulosus]|uniref:Uncharacterized protein n=1 Tax=Phascolomyces articulosus TaxID=60185 RepID=A0AAD5KA16_9FUNG|nr:hypothetical protein BDA99DRAFT_537281 [Phascolomyces articulosus]